VLISNSLHCDGINVALKHFLYVSGNGQSGKILVKKMYVLYGNSKYLIVDGLLCPTEKKV